MEETILTCVAGLLMLVMGGCFCVGGSILFGLTLLFAGGCMVAHLWL